MYVFFEGSLTAHHDYRNENYKMKCHGVIDDIDAVTQLVEGIAKISQSWIFRFQIFHGSSRGNAGQLFVEHFKSVTKKTARQQILINEKGTPSVRENVSSD